MLLHKGSHPENTWIQMPTSSSSYVSNVPRKRAFDESANWRDRPEIAYNRRWMRNKISKLISFGIENEKVASDVEWFLFLRADSKEAYMNQETLNQRVHNECMSFPTTKGKSLQSEDSNLMLPQLVSMDTSENSNILFPRMRSSLEMKDTRIMRSHNGNNEAMLQPTTRQKMMDYAFGVSSVNNASIDQSTHEMVQPCSFETPSEVKQQLEFPLFSIDGEADKYGVEQFANQVLHSVDISRINNNVMVDLHGETFETDTFPSNGLEAGGQISDESDCMMIDSRNSVEIDSVPTRRKELIIIDDEEEDIQGRTGFNQDWIQSEKEFSEPKADQKNQSEFSYNTVNEIFNNVFGSETYPFKGLEAVQISD